MISGVPLSLDSETFLHAECVCEARGMKQSREGRKEDSESVCLTFDG